ncbi:MAG: hypothetical protein NZV14_12075 [Bryobacteraceae bacterium]|nr:hypothetical protein [Bryobacteraceae bacterium]MDW8378890.1 hypothetical protein [Bryobacterales bacterium]
MGSPTKVFGEGNRIILDFETLADALRFWKPWGDCMRRVEVTELLHNALSSVGVSLELRVQGKSVAELGGDVKSGLALRLIAGAKG